MPEILMLLDFYTNFNTFTLDNLHKFKVLLIVHEFFSHHPDQLPPIFSYFVKRNSDLHSHDTRFKPHFTVLHHFFGSTIN